MKDKRDFAKSYRSFTRYLESQVGRRWDDVYHDICSSADPRSALGSTTRRRIEWNVDLNCFRGVDGEIYCVDRGGHYPVDGLYVDPTTFKLAFANRESYHGNWSKPKSWERDIDYIQIDKNSHYEKENGVWFLHWVEFVDYGEAERFWNTESKQYENTGKVIWKVREVKHKRQLNTKEIKKLDLSSGTNKDLIARLGGSYIPASRWI